VLEKSEDEAGEVHGHGAAALRGGAAALRGSAALQAWR
jgi:hypothetical protein